MFSPITAQVLIAQNGTIIQQKEIIIHIRARKDTRAHIKVIKGL